MKHSVLFAALLVASFTASELKGLSITPLELPEGNIILQGTGASPILTGSGTASADTRTLYFFSGDFGDPAPNTHDFDSNNAWPYVYVVDPLDISAGVSATISTFNDGVGDALLINGNPVYQFINDTTALSAVGNFGPWFFIEPDGTATQEVIPEPSHFAAIAGLLALGLLLRRRLNKS